MAKRRVNNAIINHVSLAMKGAMIIIVNVIISSAIVIINLIMAVANPLAMPIITMAPEITTVTTSVEAVVAVDVGALALTMHKHRAMAMRAARTTV